MLSLIRKLSGNLLVPFGWTVITIILLCLPGSDLPHSGFIDSIRNLDKLIHLVLFGGIVVLWGTWSHLRTSNDQEWFKFVCGATLATITLGIAMEYVQLYLIPNRDFDKADISADIAGAIAGFGYLIIHRRK
jgi:hypothetical protein